MKLIFIDKFNRLIRLPEERIKHIGRHMHINDKLHIIEETLKNPDILFKDEYKRGIFYYQKYLKTENLYFIIVVKVFNGSGFILTIFKSNKIIKNEG